jgi:hypothetical protein
VGALTEFITPDLRRARKHFRTGGDFGTGGQLVKKIALRLRTSQFGKSLVYDISNDVGRVKGLDVFAFVVSNTHVSSAPIALVLS